MGGNLRAKNTLRFRQRALKSCSCFATLGHSWNKVRLVDVARPAVAVPAVASALWGWWPVAGCQIESPDLRSPPVPFW